MYVLTVRVQIYMVPGSIPNVCADRESSNIYGAMVAYLMYVLTVRVQIYMVPGSIPNVCADRESSNIYGAMVAY